MTHTRLRTSFAILLMLVMSILPYSAFAQEYTIDVNMDNGSWYQWNNNPSSPYARSWYSSNSPHISVCSKNGTATTTDIRNNSFSGANNMAVWNSNNLTFYSTSSTASYEIMVADGWRIKSVEFDFNSTTADVGIGVTLANNGEVISTGPDDTQHVSLSTSDESIYAVLFNVSRKGTTSGFARTSNFRVTVAQDLSLAARYSALMSDAKMQLAGALRLSNARSEINSSNNLVTAASQLSSPYTEPNEGSIEALLDGSPSTFWHSKWSGGSVPNHTHYLQVDLGSPLFEDIAMTFTRRPVNNDHITVWSVYGSNNSNGDNWENLSYLYTPYGSNTETITSLPFSTQGYQYLRFYIDNTTTGRGYGHMSEFQLNPANLVVDPGITFIPKAITLGNIVGRQNLMDINDIGQAEYDELKAANDALREEFIFSFEVGGIYYKLTNIENSTVAVSYQGPSYDWYNNEYAGNVVIPAQVTYQGKTYNVTSIDERAFYRCPSLTAVTIPNSITSIGASAFDNCDNLTSVTVSQTTPIVLVDATFSNRANASLYVPSGSEAAYEAAPYWSEFGQIGEPASPNIVFADANVKALCVANWDTNSDGELSYAEAAAVTDLGEVFKDNATITSFNELQYFTGLTEIGERQIYNCLNLTAITLPNSITSLGDWALAYNPKLASIIIPDGVTSIGEWAFYGDFLLASVNIPSNVTAISAHTFETCFSLTSITIPNTITSIGRNAFSGSGLTSVFIPNSVTTIGIYPFVDCTNLTEIIVENGNPNYDSREGCNAIIETATNTLISGCQTTIIPNTVTAIGNSAFSGHTGLTSIVIPSSVTSIGNDAFYGCSNLTSVLTYSTTPLPISENCFTNRANATLYVPMGCKAAYEAADYWKEFKEIIEIRGDVNDDGVINLTDKEELISWLLSQIYDDAYDARYDVNKDGRVDVRDALRILEIIAVQP